MKKVTVVMLFFLCLILFGCDHGIQAAEEKTAQQVLDYLEQQNAVYVSGKKNSGDISDERRQDTAANGQSPLAVVIACSDSRVPPEHIFGAGIGDLFVIRTAGNVIGAYELGSVEYGVEHLGCKLVLVLGHTQCGAVDAALTGGAHGAIKAITDEIARCFAEGSDAREAERLNVANSIGRIMESDIIQELVAADDVKVTGAIYDIETGEVEFMDLFY